MVSKYLINLPLTNPRVETHCQINKPLFKQRPKTNQRSLKHTFFCVSTFFFSLTHLPGAVLSQLCLHFNISNRLFCQLRIDVRDRACRSSRLMELNYHFKSIYSTRGREI